MNKTIIVYGFEHDYQIWLKDDAIVCKSIDTHLPIYASPITVVETEMNIIFEKIKELEKNNDISFRKIDKLAKTRNKNASWKIASFDNKLNFDVGYESEGDENNEGR